MFLRIERACCAAATVITIWALATWDQAAFFPPTRPILGWAADGRPWGSREQPILVQIHTPWAHGSGRGAPRQRYTPWAHGAVAGHRGRFRSAARCARGSPTMWIEAQGGADPGAQAGRTCDVASLAPRYRVSVHASPQKIPPPLASAVPGVRIYIYIYI